MLEATPRTRGCSIRRRGVVDATPLRYVAYYEQVGSHARNVVECVDATPLHYVAYYEQPDLSGVAE